MKQPAAQTGDSLRNEPEPAAAAVTAIGPPPAPHAEEVLLQRLDRYLNAANGVAPAMPLLRPSPGFGDYDLGDYRNFELGD